MWCGLPHVFRTAPDHSGLNGTDFGVREDHVFTLRVSTCIMLEGGGGHSSHGLLRTCSSSSSCDVTPIQGGIINSGNLKGAFPGQLH